MSDSGALDEHTHGFLPFIDRRYPRKPYFQLEIKPRLDLNHHHVTVLFDLLHSWTEESIGGQVFKTCRIFKTSLNYGVFFVEPSWKRPGIHLPSPTASATVFMLRRNQTPSTTTSLRWCISRWSLTRRLFARQSHPPHDITGVRSYWTECPSAKRADQWWLAWQRGGLSSRCSAVAMATMDAECCWVLCVGRVWMGMTSLREPGEKQHLLQLLGLFIRTWRQHHQTNVARYVWKWDLIVCKAERMFLGSFSKNRGTRTRND